MSAPPSSIKVAIVWRKTWHAPLLPIPDAFRYRRVSRADSSIVIDAGQRGEAVERLIERVIAVTGDQDAVLSAMGLTELIDGLYRAKTPALRLRRQSYLDEVRGKAGRHKTG